MYPTLAMPSTLAPPSLAPRRSAPRRSAPPRLAPCLTAISTATRQDSASTPNRTAPEKRFLISIFIGPSSTRRLAAARAPPPSRPARRRTRRTDSRARRGARGRRRSCPHLALDPEDRAGAARREAEPLGVLADLDDDGPARAPPHRFSHQRMTWSPSLRAWER